MSKNTDPSKGMKKQWERIFFSAFVLGVNTRAFGSKGIPDEKNLEWVILMNAQCNWLKSSKEKMMVKMLTDKRFFRYIEIIIHI